MDIDKELTRIINKIRMRLTAFRVLKFIIIGIFISSAFGLLLAITARFVPVYHVYFIILFVILVSIVVLAAVSLCKRINSKAAALKADSLGLNERSVTALELLGNTSSFARIQKQDALTRLAKLDYKHQIKFEFNLRLCASCLILLICIGISAFIPNPMKNRADEIHKIKQLQTSEIKKIDSIEKQIEKNDKISDFVKEDIKNKLQDLKKDIKLAQNQKDVNKEIAKADKKVEIAKGQYIKPDLKSIEDTLSKNSATKPIAEAIKKSDENQLKEQIKKAAESLKNLSDNEKKDLAKNLSELSKNLKDNPDLAKAMSSLSQKMAQGELGNIKDELSELQNSASELMKDENIKNAMADVQKQLKEAASGDKDSDMDNGEDGNISVDNDSNQNKANNQSSSQNPGQGAGSGQGNGSGQASDQSDGSGIGGSGAGNGTGMSDSGISGEAQVGTSGLGKDGTSDKKVGEYEKVYTPKNLGGKSDKSSITGKKNNDGSIQSTEADQSITEAGESVSYDQVVGEYTQRAYEGMNNSDIPEGMKNVVKNYFTSLGQ